MQAWRRLLRTVLPVVAAITIVVAVPVTVLAHGGGTEPKVELEPPQVTAGGTAVIAGENMEPDTDRVILLAGQNLIVQFGTVKTDAEGMFSLTVTVPSHLPSGVYQVQAIGDETISADLQVTAGAGMPSAEPVAQEEVQARSPDSIALVLLIAVVGLLALAGGWLVASAERLAGHQSP